MNEFELKLEVPASQLKVLQGRVMRLPARAKVLRAVYYDTSNGDLARHGLVLRVRKEGGRWVQTLKGESGRFLERLEDEADLGQGGPDAPLPVVDAHRGSAVGRRLKKAVPDSLHDVVWRPLFSTEVRRTVATVKQGGSTIEIALDRGRIIAGDREVLLREIEFELKEGAVADAVSVARQWLSEHALWLNPVSKFEKGQRLASNKGEGEAATAEAPGYEPDADLAAVASASLGACLDQVLRNAAEIAAGHANADLVHQLRIGIRRTRTLLRHVYKDVAEPSIEPALLQAFRALGQQRDVDHVLKSLAPAIEAAGGPHVVAKAARDAAPSPTKTVRSAEFQDALLALVALAHADNESLGRKARPAIEKELRKLREQVLADGAGFEQLDATRQHRVRKRLKRLRYLAEFAAPLYSSRKSAAFVSALKPVQDALGLYNDEQTALAWYRERARADAHAQFAIGWLTARREGQAAACARALRDFSKARPFWKDE